MNDRDMNDIREVMRLAQSGEKEAFSRVYTEFYAPIYRYIFVRTKSRETTEDLTQDVFLKAFKSLSSFKITEHSPLAYFYTIARNTVIDFYRKRTLATTSDEDVLENIPDTHAELDPGTTAMRREEKSELLKYLDKLTDDQKEMLTMKFINELSNKEIANITGRSEAAIRQLQVRGLRALAALYKKDHE